jgi:PiT family inorganic phosphate transporter
VARRHQGGAREGGHVEGLGVLAVHTVARLAQAYQILTIHHVSIARSSPAGSQTASASLVSLAHGTNDAQKTMGIITLT